MNSEEPFLVVVNSAGTFVELRDPFHRQRPYKVVMQLSDEGKTVSEYHELSIFDRDLAGFFVRKSVPVERDEVFRYSVESFVNGASVGDVSVLFVYLSKEEDPDLRVVLPYITDLSSFCALTYHREKKTICAVCVFPEDCLSKQLWPRVTSCMGCAYADGYTTIRLPTIPGVDWSAVDVSPKIGLLRSCASHKLRGICSDSALVDALKAYVYDETDHMGFLTMRNAGDTYNDLSVEEGDVRMIREEDFCAIYADDSRSNFFLVLYMRLPDATEDQLYHLLMDNAVARDWNTWARSDEIGNAKVYSEARRKAAASYCFRMLLQSDVFQRFSETDKCKWCSDLPYRSVCYNVLLAESNCFTNSKKTIRQVCFYKNSYNMSFSSGYVMCELMNTSRETTFPRLMMCDDAVPLVAKKSTFATAIPRYIDDETTFHSFIDLYSRDQSDGLHAYAIRLSPVKEIVPKYRSTRE